MVLKCCFCGQIIKSKVMKDGSVWWGGNNAQPFYKTARCCDVCNECIVIPKRVELILDIYDEKKE